MTQTWNQIIGQAWRDLQMALHSGEPPLWVQLALVTMAFILARLYVFWRRKRQMKTPPPEWITGTYLVLLAVLSLGVVQYALHFYREYLRYIYYAVFG